MYPAGYIYVGTNMKSHSYILRRLFLLLSFCLYVCLFVFDFAFLPTRQSHTFTILKDVLYVIKIKNDHIHTHQRKPGEANVIFLLKVNVVERSHLIYKEVLLLS